jgi:hypothetical protein
MLITDKKHMAELFHHHFIKSGLLFDSAIPPLPSNISSSPTLSNVTIHNASPSFSSATATKFLSAGSYSVEGFKGALETGSGGLDHFFFRLLPLSSPSLSPTFLTCLSCLSRPLFKGGDQADPNCYRPISILPCLSKVLEKLVNNQLTGFLDVYNILSGMQSSFRSGYGRVTVTLKVLNDITIALDSKQCCTAIFFHLAKAFDTVDHSILVSLRGLWPGLLTTSLKECSV